jgi:hypothetical protein
MKVTEDEGIVAFEEETATGVESKTGARGLGMARRDSPTAASLGRFPDWWE